MGLDQLFSVLPPKEYRNIQGFITGIVFVMIYSAEHLYPQRKSIIDYKHELFNFSIGVINQVIVFFAGIGLYYCMELAAYYHFGLFHQVQLNFALALILQFILLDLWMYWWHRLNHTLPFLWHFHKFHHKDTKLNSTSALRFHIGELLLSTIIRILPFTLLGIDPVILLVYSSILFVVIVFHHSNLRISDKVDLGLRKIIVTPLMHRIHHSVIRRETDSNYSSVFPYWDMLFKSYNHSPSKHIEFGIEEDNKHI